MTRWERKEALGYGVLGTIARRTRRSVGHVSHVVKGDRRDRVVEKEIARRLKRSVEEVFGPMPEPDLKPAEETEPSEQSAESSAA